MFIFGSTSTFKLSVKVGINPLVRVTWNMRWRESRQLSSAGDHVVTTTNPQTAERHSCRLDDFKQNPAERDVRLYEVLDANLFPPPECETE